jgi:protein-L-isoaspartate(D-aspartate) O-methyltransferase
MHDPAHIRLTMVDSQLRPNKVTDPALLAAFLAIPRERFVPEPLRGAAYFDEDLPLGRGRYLLEPMVLARLLQAALVRSTDRVLILGCGTGYSAALVAQLAGTVIAVESDADFVRQAGASLQELGIRNVTMIERALPAGDTTRAPFDVILLDGAVAELPDALIEQLGEGGRLVAIVKPHAAPMGHAILVERVGGALSRRTLFEAGSHVLPGFAAEPAFSF